MEREVLEKMGVSLGGLMGRTVGCVALCLQGVESDCGAHGDDVDYDADGGGHEDGVDGDAQGGVDF